MRIRCPNCGTQVQLDGEEFANRPTQVICWMCLWSIVPGSPPTEPNTEPSPPTIAVSSSAMHERSGAPRLDSALASQTASLRLPQGETIKISVITGSSQGLECELSRPLVTVGRLGGGADIEIDDPEVSRLHCSVEVKHDVILLRDLHSTNGTYLGETRIVAARLEHMSRFRIGLSLLQLSIVSPEEKDVISDKR
jgi:hypothetical protein